MDKETQKLLTRTRGEMAKEVGKNNTRMLENYYKVSKTSPFQPLFILIFLNKTNIDQE